MHTKGPWAYIQNESKIVSVTEYMLYSDLPITVISTYGAMGGNNCKDDAVLMAASPELLDACEQSLLWLTEPSKSTIDTKYMMVELLKNVIAKAKGK